MKKILAILLVALLAVSCCGMASAEFDVWTTSNTLYYYTDTDGDGTSDTYAEYALISVTLEENSELGGLYYIAGYYCVETGCAISVTLDSNHGSGTSYSSSIGSNVIPVMFMFMDGATEKIMLSACANELYNQSSAYCDLMITEADGNHRAGGLMGYLADMEETELLYFWADFDFTYTPEPVPATPEPSHEISCDITGDYYIEGNVLFVGANGASLTFSGAASYKVALYEPDGSLYLSFDLNGSTLNIDPSTLHTDAPSTLEVTAVFSDGATETDSLLIQAAPTGASPDVTPAPQVTQEPANGRPVVPQTTPSSPGRVIPK